MSHAHAHPEAGGRRRKRLTAVLVLSSVVMLCELAVGIVSGSLALLADAVHMFADVTAVGLALFAVWFAGRPSPPNRTYGHHRIEILAAAGNAVLLSVVMVFVVLEALRRLQAPPQLDAWPVLITGTVGLAANLVGARLLHADAKHSLNVRGAYLEVLADALGSVGVVAAAVCIALFDWRRADPIASLAIALFVVPRVWVLLREVTDVLMEAAPRNLDVASVRARMLQADGVLDVHDLHVWTITSGRVCLSAHVVTRPGIDRDDVIEALNSLLRSAFNIEHSTLQVEGERMPAMSGPGHPTRCDPCP
jgi:cobalt-zinc-cadmium efflux system protein